MNIKKIRDNNVILYLLAFLIPFLMMQIFWTICGIYPFGEHTILTGDMDIEFVDFYAYFINTLKTNNDWSYMLTKTLGGDYPGLAAFQLHDPLLLLLLLFPGEKIVTGIELIFSLQISIAGLSASVLLNNRYKKTWASLAFSTGYAFSAFFFGYLVLTIYFGALSILPVVIFFFLKYVEEEKFFAPFVLSTSYFIFLNYHMGFMLVIFMVILYVSRLIAKSATISGLPKLAVAGVTVLLIDGFFLVRTGLSLIGEKTTQGADYGFYRRFPMNQLFAGLFAGCARNNLRPLIYCGVAAFFFAVVYFLSKKISIREKAANLFVIVALAVSMWINSIDAVWHGFNNPEGFYWRYAYYISLTIIAIGYRGYLEIAKESETDERSRFYIITSTFILFIYMAWLTVTRNAYLDRQRLLINVFLVAAVSVISLIVSKGGKNKTAGVIILIAVTLPEMLYSSKTAYISLNSEGKELPLFEKFKEDYESIDDVISYIKSGDDGFYRIEKDFDRAINDPSMFDYVGLSHDSSCEKDELIDWLENFGFCRTVYFTYYNGGSTSFVDDLFGIKYYVSRFDSIEKPYEHLDYSGKYHAYFNENALPMAYIAPNGLREEDVTRGNTFEMQNRLVSHWSDRPVYLKADPSLSLDGAEDEGEGKYKRIEEEGYIVYNIHITEAMPLYFYFSAPSRQNGEVFVNGESRDVYFTENHWNTLCAGRFAPGEDVEIRMQIKDEELTISEACFCYEDKEALEEWGKAAKSLNAFIGPVNKITSSHFTFEVNGNDPETVNVSVPFEDSWKVTCDGQILSAQPAMGELMSFDVPAGEHIIDMKYTPAGTYPGAILSVSGILLFALQIIIAKKKEGKQS